MQNLILIRLIVIFIRIHLIHLLIIQIYYIQLRNPLNLISYQILRTRRTIKFLTVIYIFKPRLKFLNYLIHFQKILKDQEQHLILKFKIDQQVLNIPLLNLSHYFFMKFPGQTMLIYYFVIMIKRISLFSVQNHNSIRFHKFNHPHLFISL